MNVLRSCAVAAALVLASAPAPAASDDVVKAGPHFRVTCHFGDEATATAALETV